VRIDASGIIFIFILYYISNLTTAGKLSATVCTEKVAKNSKSRSHDNHMEELELRSWASLWHYRDTLTQALNILTGNHHETVTPLRLLSSWTYYPWWTLLVKLVGWKSRCAPSPSRLMLRLSVCSVYGSFCPFRVTRPSAFPRLMIFSLVDVS
jgi:hypothetical protein